MAASRPKTAAEGSYPSTHFQAFVTLALYTGNNLGRCLDLEDRFRHTQDSKVVEETQDC